jgi:hypothetical protein
MDMICMGRGRPWAGGRCFAFWQKNDGLRELIAHCFSVFPFFIFSGKVAGFALRGEEDPEVRESTRRDFAANAHQERWQSGRMRQTRNLV